MKRTSVFLVAATLLAGCGRGGAVEQPVLDAMREKGVERCEMMAGPLLSSRGVGADIEKVCGCAVDRAMKGKSAAQVMQMTKASPELREAAERCAIEALNDSRK